MNSNDDQMVQKVAPYLLERCLDDRVAVQGVVELVQQNAVTASISRRRQPKLVPLHFRSAWARRLRSTHPGVVGGRMLLSWTPMVIMDVPSDCVRREHHRAPSPSKDYDGVLCDGVNATRGSSAFGNDVEC